MKSDTIDGIVREVLLDAGLPLHFYLRHLNWLLRGLKEFTSDLSLSKKSVELDVTTYNSIILPTDYVDRVSVSAKYGDRLLKLAYDSSLNISYNTDDQGNKIPHPETNSERLGLSILTNSSGLTYSDSNTNEGFKGGYFAHVPEQGMTYKIDEVNNEIRLGNNVKVSKILLEYVTQGVSSVSVNTVVPQASDALRNWAHYQRVLNGPYPQSEKERRKRIYEVSADTLRKRRSNLDYATILRSLRQSFTSGPTK